MPLLSSALFSKAWSYQSSLTCAWKWVSGASELQSCKLTFLLCRRNLNVYKCRLVHRLFVFVGLVLGDCLLTGVCVGGS